MISNFLASHETFLFSIIYLEVQTLIVTAVPSGLDKIPDLLSPFSQFPLNLLPSAQVKAPLPSFKSLIQAPTYLLSSLYLKIPYPCLRLLKNSPSYSPPSGYTHLPWPDLFPLSHCPSYLAPLGQV